MQFYKIVRALSVLAVLCAAQVSVWAQTPLGAGNEQPLNVSASTYAGYDTDITTRATRPSSVDTNADTSAFNTGVSLSMVYGHRTPKIGFYTMGSSDFRYYRAAETVTAPLATGSAGLDAALGRRLRFVGSVQSSYLPRFQLSVLPSTSSVPTEQPQPTMDYGISSYDVVSYLGTAGLSYQLDSRSALTASYGRGQFKYLGQDYELNTRTMGAGYSRKMTRYATLQLGYSEQGGDYVTGLGPNQQTIKQRTIDAGVHYSRPLSLSRRTTVGFSTGSTALDNGRETFYTVTGSANLNHQLSRTWNLGVGYARRVGLVGGFTEPIMSDSISVRAGGSLGNRVYVSTSAGYANGAVGMASRGRNYDSTQASSNINIPITRRRLSFFGTYFYYRHSFEQSVSLPIGLVPHMSRHGVRAGLTLTIY